MEKINKIVITGATSSIGTALVDECIKQNIEVLAIVNPGSKNISRITRHELVTIVECPIDGYKTLDADKYGKYDAFIHLAWAATQGNQARSMLIPQARNIEYSLDAVELADRTGCQVFVGAGSQAEYGRTDEVLTEKTITRPETPYGMAKLCAGQMTRYMCAQKGIRHIWPRILSAYGPNCQPQTVLNYTLTELMNNRRPSLSGGDQVWDFIYTADVARALLLLAEKGKDGEVYVIGSGEADLLKNYLIKASDILSDVTKKKPPVLGLGDKPYGESAVMHLACDISKLKKDTRYEATVTYEDGIRYTIEWLKGLENR